MYWLVPWPVLGGFETLCCCCVPTWCWNWLLGFHCFLKCPLCFWVCLLFYFLRSWHNVWFCRHVLSLAQMVLVVFRDDACWYLVFGEFYWFDIGNVDDSFVYVWSIVVLMDTKLGGATWIWRQDPVWLVSTIQLVFCFLLKKGDDRYQRGGYHTDRRPCVFFLFSSFFAHSKGSKINTRPPNLLPNNVELRPIEVIDLRNNQGLFFFWNV